VIALAGERVRLALDDGQSVTLLRRAGYALKVGACVSFLVRPERIRLDGKGENRICGVVRGVEFLGDAAIIHLEGAGQGWLIKVTDPDDDLMRLEGSEITVSFSPADGQIHPPQTSNKG